jgi:NADPH:quinone reductase-like Zn-dependent oxidoreductase
VQVKPMAVSPDPGLLLELAEAVQKGAFSVPLGQKFSLADAAKAHAAAEKGSAGKILLVI